MPLCGVTSIRWINLLQNGISHQHVLSYNPTFGSFLIESIDSLKKRKCNLQDEKQSDYFVRKNQIYMPEYDKILYKKYIYLHSIQKKNHMHEKTGEGHNKGSKRITGGAVCGR